MSTNAVPDNLSSSRATPEIPAAAGGKIGGTGACVDVEKRAFALIPYTEFDLATRGGDWCNGTIDASFLAAAAAREALFFAAAVATVAACGQMIGVYGSGLGRAIAQCVCHPGMG
jgi:hypothetical protein